MVTACPRFICSIQESICSVSKASEIQKQLQYEASHTQDEEKDSMKGLVTRMVKIVLMDPFQLLSIQGVIK